MIWQGLIGGWFIQYMQSEIKWWSKEAKVWQKVKVYIGETIWRLVTRLKERN